MAIIKNTYQTNFSGPQLSTFTTTTGGVAQNIAFGLLPDSIEAWNLTQATTPTSGKISKFFWTSTMPAGSAFKTLYTSAPADETSYITSNGVTPYQTTDQDLWVPNQTPYTTNNSTALVITGISQASQAVITATNSFTSADNNVTWVTFSQVVGMTQINTLRGQVVNVASSNPSTTSFAVNINTLNFTAYSSGGQANVITGAPVTTQFGPQIIQTPQRNLGLAGLTLGTALMQNTSDVWYFRCMWNGPVDG